LLSDNTMVNMAKVLTKDRLSPLSFWSGSEAASGNKDQDQTLLLESFRKRVPGVMSQSHERVCVCVSQFL
jgi:hypothetical protein